MSTKSTRNALTTVLNIFIVIAGCAGACLLLVFGLRYDSIDFINEHRMLLISLAIGICFILLIASIIFFVLGKKALFRFTLCIIICAVFISAIFFGISATGFIKNITGKEALREFIAASDNYAVMVFLFILLQFLQVVILPIPSSVTVMAGAMLFGPWLSSLYSFIGILIGSVVAFAVGRLLGYRVVCWIVGKEELDKWLAKIRGKDYLILSVMFLLPLFPDDILCFVAGLSSMTWPYFIVMIVITRALTITLSSLTFDSIPFNTWWGLLCWALIVATVIVLFWLVIKFSDKIDNFIKNKLGLKLRGRRKHNGNKSKKKNDSEEQT